MASRRGSIPDGVPATPVVLERGTAAPQSLQALLLRHRHRTFQVIAASEQSAARSRAGLRAGRKDGVAGRDEAFDSRRASYTNNTAIEALARVQSLVMNGLCSIIHGMKP